MKTTKPTKKAAPRLLTVGSNEGPTHSEIALRAYSLWEQQGRPANHEVQIWLQAETQVRQIRSQYGLQA